MIRYILIIFLLLSNLEGHEKRIAILSHPGFLGEHSFAGRIVQACNNINWSAEVWDVNHLDNFENQYFDFVICLVPGGYRHPYCPNYITIYHPVHHYFHKDGYLRKEYKHYDGYLLTYPVNGDKKDFADADKFPFMQWYPTVHNIDYKGINPKFLFFVCCVWGNRHGDVKYRNFLSKLDKQPYMRFYGRPYFKDVYPRSYIGPISFDGNDLYNLASDAGISLVLHSSDHLCYGLPSGRIFEAAAASTVIISDKNAFVQEHFGNSVLYIDINQSAKAIFNEINNHIKWIYTHKKKAQEMAQRSHQIYKEKFLLEEQLRRLGEFSNQRNLIRVPKGNI